MGSVILFSVLELINIRSVRLLLGQVMIMHWLHLNRVINAYCEKEKKGQLNPMPCFHIMPFLS